MDSFLLKILDLFRGLFSLARVDYEQLRAIVAIKLIMDNRRQVVTYRRKEGSEPGNAFAWTLFFSVVFGGFMALAMFQIPSFMIAMILVFSYVMVMIAMTLITDFSSVLLDTSDNTIILPRPVDSRTLFVARISHILLYLGQLTLGLILIPALVMLVQYGIVMLLLFMICTVLSVLTAVFITNAFYLLIMQFASEEKLRNVINYFQIVMVVAVMGGYQLMPRMMDRFGLEEMTFEITWWSYLAPPIWMAGALEMFRFSLYDMPHVALTFCAVVIPLAGFYSVNRYLTPLFSRKLGAMAGTSQASRPQHRKEKESRMSQLSRWITNGPFEQGSFILISKILARDRKIKLKVYPSFGYIIVFGLIFIVRSKEDLATTFANLPYTEYHLLLLYLTFMVLQVALHEIPYSDDFKASWIYFSTPLDKPGEILTGALKAIFVRLFVPVYAVISIFVLVIWGAGALDDIVFGFFNNLLMLLILALLGRQHLPLSLAPSVRGQAGNFLRGVLTFVLIATLGLIHYLLTRYPMILLAIIPVQMGSIWLMMKAYRGMGWRRIAG
jgi:hypothetical protein